MSEILERTLPITRSINEPPQVQQDRLTGYAVVYGVQSSGPVPVGSVYLPEVIEAGAFSDLSRNITFTFNHKDFAEYGSTDTKTLQLSEDEKGVSFNLLLPNYATTLRNEVTIGAIKGMSFGFTDPVFEVRNGIRYISKATLLHLAAVYNPAYVSTSVVLARAGTLEKKKQILKLLEG